MHFLMRGKNLLTGCVPNMGKYFTDRWYISISIHSQQLRIQRSSWQCMHALHSYLEMPITGSVQKQLQGPSKYPLRSGAFHVEHPTTGTVALFLKSKENGSSCPGVVGFLFVHLLFKINDGKRAIILTASARIQHIWMKNSETNVGL